MVGRARPKDRVLAVNTRLHDAVRAGLEQRWSPRQVSRRLRREFPDDDAMRVSHETIYQTLYLQARGELRTQLALATRRGRTRRVNRSRAAVSRGNIVGMVNISERPVEAGTDLSVHSQVDLDAVATELNGRPRETLDWRNPTEAFNELLLKATGAPTT